jgi:hypothetical protein
MSCNGLLDIFGVCGAVDSATGNWASADKAAEEGQTDRAQIKAQVDQQAKLLETITQMQKQNNDLALRPLELQYQVIQTGIQNQTLIAQDGIHASLQSEMWRTTANMRETISMYVLLAISLIVVLNWSKAGLNLFKQRPSPLPPVDPDYQQGPPVDPDYQQGHPIYHWKQRVDREKMLDARLLPHYVDHTEVFLDEEVEF